MALSFLPCVFFLGLMRHFQYAYLTIDSLVSYAHAGRGVPALRGGRRVRVLLFTVAFVLAGFGFAESAEPTKQKPTAKNGAKPASTSKRVSVSYPKNGSKVAPPAGVAVVLILSLLTKTSLPGCAKQLQPCKRLSELDARIVN